MNIFLYTYNKITVYQNYLYERLRFLNAEVKINKKDFAWFYENTV